MKRLIIIAGLFLFCLNNYGQEKFLKDKSETQELSEEVVRLFKENRISDSFERLSLYWPIPGNEIDAIEDKTIKYLNIIDQRFGKSIGSEKIKNETISDFAIRETYMIRYENTAIRVIFTYYKNEQGWIVNAFKWDDSFSDEFK